MAPKDEKKNQYEDLTAGTDVPADGDFSLEEILAEYGGGRKQQILRDVEAALRAAGFRESRLAVDKGNPQSWAFWTKNGYTRYGPEKHNGTSAYLPMKKTL